MPHIKLSELLERLVTWLILADLHDAWGNDITTCVITCISASLAHVGHDLFLLRHKMSVALGSFQDLWVYFKAFQPAKVTNQQSQQPDT